jgi:benzoyl-CoA reductase/2-hydroxyglutaryl-CoA dehydratase subunit BcrC/BadD/HgdB
MADPMETYGAMWESLGMNLRAHCALLDAIPKMYQSAYLSQDNRPEGMKYFDFVVSEIHGLRIQELQEHKAKGGKVVGTFCLYVPEEIIRALGALDIGLCAGAEWGYNEVEKVLPRNTCALIKSFVGFKMDRVCPYVESADLVIGETTCDGKKKAYEIFGEMAPLYVMELPQMKRPNDLAAWRDEIGRLVVRLEELTGNKLTAENLKAAILEVNGKRRALQRLNAARAASPVPISGKDALLAVQVAFYDDVPRFTQMVNTIADELEQRIADGAGVASADAPRIIVSGSPMAIPNWKLHDIIEKSGAVVVAEEMCTGSRYYDKLTPEDGATLDDLLDGVAAKYLDINCACFTPNTARFDDVLRMAKENKADGIVHYALQFCAPYQIEAYGLEKAAKAAGVPLLKIDTDYSMEDIGQLQTRVEAFLEMVKEPAAV